MLHLFFHRAILIREQKRDFFKIRRPLFSSVESVSVRFGKADRDALYNLN